MGWNFESLQDLPGRSSVAIMSILGLWGGSWTLWLLGKGLWGYGPRGMTERGGCMSCGAKARVAGRGLMDWKAMDWSRDLSHQQYFAGAMNPTA